MSVLDAGSRDGYVAMGQRTALGDVLDDLLDFLGWSAGYEGGVATRAYFSDLALLVDLGLQVLEDSLIDHVEVR